MLRYTISFTGTVQGVGFRYATLHIAQSYSITGWVRNEADGSVRCIVEGEKHELDRFLASVKQSMQANIADARIEAAPATGEFTGFTIRR